MESQDPPSRPPSPKAQQESKETTAYSSPACYLAEVDEAEGPASERWEDVKAWRKAQRARLVALRVALPAAQRHERAQSIVRRLETAAEIRPRTTLGIYWPIRGELDLRDLARRHAESGGHTALPVIVRKAAPVEFWRWQPQMRTRPGVWGIPVPFDRDVVTPDVLIVPLVGFDARRFRLGYGAGYYDRTLAALTPRPVTIGVGFADAQLATIHPQAHDIPMDLIITDRFRLP